MYNAQYRPQIITSQLIFFSIKEFIYSKFFEFENRFKKKNYLTFKIFKNMV